MYVSSSSASSSSSSYPSRSLSTHTCVYVYLDYMDLHFSRPRLLCKEGTMNTTEAPIYCYDDVEQNGDLAQI